MDTKESDSPLPVPEDSEELPPKQDVTVSEKPVVKEKRFRLYEKPSSHFCLFFQDVYRNYPAVLSIMEVWDIAEKPAEHKIEGVPCIIDLHSPDVWLGSKCFEWLRRAVVASAQQIPIIMPANHLLRKRYSSSPSTDESSTDISSPSVSPEIDANQEESLQQEVAASAAAAAPEEETQSQ